MPTLKSPFGTYPLQRIPRDPTHTLRAWDAADEYLLAHLHQNSTKMRAPLILNDAFGALGISLQRFNPVLVSDSVVSQLALQANLSKAQAATELRMLDSLAPLPETSLVLIKQPKSAAYFDYQLQAMNHYLPPGTPVIVGAMVKYLSKVFINLLARHLDSMHTSQARKKARLVFGTVKGNYPKPELLGRLDFPEYHLTLCNTPNVFAAAKIDIGSRFFLAHFPALKGGAQHVIDLGCGNGLLGIYALQQNPELQVTFVDESWQALHAARCSAQASLGDTFNLSRTNFKANHCLQGFAADSASTILCNPPFHQQQSTNTQIARQMFRDSAQVLKPEGNLYVIGNRHLRYPIELKNYFHEVELLASNQKFVLLSASRSKG